MGSARVLSGGSSVHDHARPSARDAAARAYPSGTANCANLPTKTDKGGDSLASTFVIGLAGFLSVQRAHNGESLAPCPFFESAGGGCRSRLPQGRTNATTMRHLRISCYTFGRCNLACRGLLLWARQKVDDRSVDSND